MRKLWESAREPELESFRTVDFEQFFWPPMGGRKLLSFPNKELIGHELPGRSYWTDRSGHGVIMPPRR